MKKISVVNKIFSILFLFLVFFFFLFNVFTEDKSFSYSENRLLEQKPEISIEKIFDGIYMDKVEKYVNDQIIFRNNFIKISTYSKLLLGQKEINDVYICDNYLIEKFEESEIDFKLLNKNLEYVNQFLIKYPNSSVGFIPTSTEIYKDKISKYANNVNQKELIDSFGFDNSVNFYDILNIHSNEDIYFKTDHHWSNLGAYYGYLAICEKLGLSALSLNDFDKEIIDDKFSGTIQSKVNFNTDYDILYKYIPRYFNGTYQRIVDEDYRNVSDSLYDESKLKTKEKYAVYIGGNSAVVRIITEGGIENKGRLLLIKDSFSHSLVPFLTNHYSEIVLLDLRYYMGGVEYFLKNEKEPFDNILIIYNLKNFVNDKNLILLNK